MYTIEPKSLKEFVDDIEIKLPRFQRKSTWDTKQNFELALSVFKNYPLGAIICFKEIENKETTKWLLDGRQRRNALKEMYENPEALYVWAKKYLGIKNSFKEQDIKDKFWTAVDDYIEKDVTEDETDESEEDDNIPANYQVNVVESETEKLDVLLDLILVGYSNSKKGFVSGITKCFDMKSYFENIRNMEKRLYDKDNKSIDCTKLKKFLKDYRNDQGKDYINYDNFEKYMDDMFTLSDSSKTSFRTKYKYEWSNVQLKVIRIFECIDSIMADRKLAVIETSGIKSADEQKIFNLINNSGTQLTASEILSAKPRWNIKIDGINKEIKKSIVSLYSNNLNIDTSGIVRWDIPASLCIYLKDCDSGIDEFFTIKESDVSKKITLGFKLLSGFYGVGVKKEDINELSSLKNPVFDWENCNERINEVKMFFSALKPNIYLKCLKSWGKSLADIIGDGPTQNYLFILFRNWIALDKPLYSSKEKNIFDKNSFILLDKMFYEYVTNQWKGSSDSTIARNIENYEKTSKNELIKEIESVSWKHLLDDLFEKNMLNKKIITKGVANPLVYYYNMLINKIGLSDDENVGEIDHILPQSSWESSSLSDKEAIMNNLYNLALLPKKINGSKNDKPLLSVKTNTSLANQISDYEEIPVDDFEKYSKIENYKDLKSLRGEKYYNAFGEKRDSILVNAF